LPAATARIELTGATATSAITLISLSLSFRPNPITTRPLPPTQLTSGSTAKFPATGPVVDAGSYQVLAIKPYCISFSSTSSSASFTFCLFSIAVFVSETSLTAIHVVPGFFSSTWSAAAPKDF